MEGLDIASRENSSADDRNTSALLALALAALFLSGIARVANQTCQRQLGAFRNSLIVILFLLNTLGAVVSALGSSFRPPPWFGQWISLIAAASMNLVAGALLWLASKSAPAAVLLVGLVALLASGLTIRRSSGPGGASHWGRDNVVEVRDGGAVWIDGLMHTRLSNRHSDIGDATAGSFRGAVSPRRGASRRGAWEAWNSSRPWVSASRCSTAPCPYAPSRPASASQAPSARYTGAHVIGSPWPR